MDIYRPEQWHEFFVMIGGASAALAGLVFVALSLNVKLMTKDATHRYRAMGTLAGLVSVFVLCGFGLLGEQTHRSLGLEWLVVSLVATWVYINGYIKAKQFGNSMLGLRAMRLVVGTACYLAQIIGAVVLLAGHIAGLYIATVTMLANIPFMITGAWLLFVGASEGGNHDG